MAIEIALSELGNWLSNQPANTKDTPYELNITGLTTSNVDTIKDSLKSNPTKYVDLSNTIIPNSVTGMYDTFDGCKSLVNAPNIPDGVTTMNGTFNSCKSLVNAPVIPGSVTDMTRTFSGCTSLVNAPVIPDSVTTMKDTFSVCTSLVNAPVIPNSVTDMTHTFGGCKSLVNAPAIPNGVTSLDSTFQNCTSLTTALDISDGVTSLVSTFYHCTRLTTVRIPKNVESLSANVFSGCTSLRLVYLECPPSDGIDISSIPDTANIYVERDNLSAWQEKYPNIQFDTFVASVKLVTLSQLKEYDKARAANMVGRHTYTTLDENLIYRATQYTSDESVSAFPGTFYEVADFIESEQIPQGAKLMYLNDNTIKFCSSYPPHAGLKYGKEETVLANKNWFDNIAWMTETVSVTGFEYSIPTIEIKNADGGTRSVATQEVQAFTDSKEDVTEGLLDVGLAKTAAKLNKLDESYLPVGIVVDFLDGTDPNTIYPEMTWIEL